MRLRVSTVVAARAALLAAWMERSRAAARDLVRLRLCLPARARRRRPHPPPSSGRSRTACASSTSRRTTPTASTSSPSSSSSTSATGSALAVSWTYWNSEFTVLGLALLYVYIRRHEAFTRFRNTVLLANILGLFGYVFMPTAPPRLLGARLRRRPPRRPRLARGEPVCRDAEPARSGLADRRRRAGAPLPALVVEALLDRLACLGLVRRDGDRQPLLARLRCGRGRGAACAGHRLRTVRRGVSPPFNERSPPSIEGMGSMRHGPWYGPNVQRAAALKQGYTSVARNAASRSITGLARTRVTPNALTATGVAMCAAASVLVLLREPQPLPLLLARGTRLRRGLAARHPRRCTRARRWQDDALRRLHRLDDRPRQRGLHADRDRVRLRTPRPRRLRRGCDGRRRRLVPRLVHARPRGSAGPARRRRHRLTRRARRRHHRGARPRALGRAALGDRTARGDRVGDGRPARPARPQQLLEASRD